MHRASSEICQTLHIYDVACSSTIVSWTKYYFHFSSSTEFVSDYPVHQQFSRFSLFCVPWHNTTLEHSLQFSCYTPSASEHRPMRREIISSQIVVVPYIQNQMINYSLIRRSDLGSYFVDLWDLSVLQHLRSLLHSHGKVLHHTIQAPHPVSVIEW